MSQIDANQNPFLDFQIPGRWWWFFFGRGRVARFPHSFGVSAAWSCQGQEVLTGLGCLSAKELHLKVEADARWQFAGYLVYLSQIVTGVILSYLEKMLVLRKRCDFNLLRRLFYLTKTLLRKYKFSCHLCLLCPSTLHLFLYTPGNFPSSRDHGGIPMISL